MFKINQCGQICDQCVTGVKYTVSFHREGIWSLLPTYDLTRCSNRYNGEPATSVNNHGNTTVEDMFIVGESIRILRKKGRI